MNYFASVPGTGGNRLEAKLNRDWVPYHVCYKRADWFTIWINYEAVTYFGGRCWAENLKLHYDEQTGQVSNAKGVQIRPECFGDTSCIEWIDPHHLLPDGRYFHDLGSDLIFE